MIDQCGEKAVYPDICVNTWSPAAHYGEARGASQFLELQKQVHFQQMHNQGLDQ